MSSSRNPSTRPSETERPSPGRRDAAPARAGRPRPRWGFPALWAVAAALAVAPQLGCGLPARLSPALSTEQWFDAARPAGQGPAPECLPVDLVLMTRTGPYGSPSLARAAAVGPPQHQISDAVAGADGRAEVRGVFGYGAPLTPAAGAEVALWSRRGPCEPWEVVGRGEVAASGEFSAAIATDGFAPGLHPLVAHLESDGSRAEGWLLRGEGLSTLWVDVDAGLWRDPDARLRALVFPGGLPEADPAARATLTSLAREGVVPIYLVHGSGTPWVGRWLMEQGFPPGPVWGLAPFNVEQRARGRERLVAAGIGVRGAIVSGAARAGELVEAGVPADRLWVAALPEVPLPPGAHRFTRWAPGGGR